MTKDSLLAVNSDKYAPTFYAPVFYVYVDGQQLHEHGSDCLSVQVKDSLMGLTSFELVLNNWNDGGDGKPPRFKYSDDQKTLKLGARVAIEMGYADAPARTLMMVGEITGIEPQFPAAGGPTVRISGFDRRHRWQRKTKSNQWPNSRDSDIAKKIADDNNHMACRADETSPVHPEMPQHNVDDLKFLADRAAANNYEILMEFEGSGKNAREVLLFRKMREGEEPTMALEWGTSLASFSPSLTLSGQLTKVTVESWHVGEARLIKASADRASLAEAQGDKNAAEVLNVAFGEGKELKVTRKGIQTDEQARKEAERILQEAARTFVTGQASTVGLPTLRAGQNIYLGGLGERFSGVYYVTETTHRIDGNGYQTTFSVRRGYT
ncbi:hypothetical protein LZC95_21155 [Pendulispora brunnea]|uniref:Phage late control D family protein n=1 Tax=Pendulispora brunnea TaxID=2905690 RepID=A0ABZ2KKY2_9BACT